MTIKDIYTNTTHALLTKKPMINAWKALHETTCFRDKDIRTSPHTGTPTYNNSNDGTILWIPFHQTASTVYKKELAEVMAREGSDGDDSNVAKKRKDYLREKRDAALISHVYNMLGVFLLGCGIPSMNRLPFKQRGWIYYVLSVAFVLIMIAWGKVIERRILANSDRQRWTVKFSHINRRKSKRP